MVTLIAVLAIVFILIGLLMIIIGIGKNYCFILAMGWIVLMISSSILGIFSTVHEFNGYTTIIDDVAVSKTDNGWTMVSKDKLVLTSNLAPIYIAPNSNIVIQANAGYNAWKRTKTNSYEIAVK